MSLGQRLLELRKKINLSQEEVADKLNVTRQTVSKWETDASTPDFDKIVPLCKLYGVSTEELLTGTKDRVELTSTNVEEVKKKKAFGIGLSVLIYILSVVWIMVSIPVLRMNPIVASAIFIAICGVATFIIVYTCMVYKVAKQKEEKPKNELKEAIDGVLAIIVLIIYLSISFTTYAWHITWIIWIIYALISKMIDLLMRLRGTGYEK